VVGLALHVVEIVILLLALIAMVIPEEPALWTFMAVVIPKVGPVARTDAVAVDLDLVMVRAEITPVVEKVLVIMWAEVASVVIPVMVIMRVVDALVVVAAPFERRFGGRSRRGKSRDDDHESLNDSSDLHDCKNCI